MEHSILPFYAHHLQAKPPSLLPDPRSFLKYILIKYPFYISIIVETVFKKEL